MSDNFPFHSLFLNLHASISWCQLTIILNAIASTIERWGCRRVIWPVDPGATSANNDQRSSGGTLRQKLDLINIWHFKFDIQPMDQWTNGQNWQRGWSKKLLRPYEKKTHFRKAWMLKISKSGCRLTGYILAHHHYMSSLLSYQVHWDHSQYECNAIIALMIERRGCRRVIWPVDPDHTSANKCTETILNIIAIQ